jgi:hypothetical protein
VLDDRRSPEAALETDDPWARALALLTLDAVAALRQGPNLRPAIERLAVGARAFVASQDAFGHWVAQHDRRFTIAFTLAVLDARDMGTTAGELLRTCQQMYGLNRGVVADFVDRGVASGDLAIESADAAWGHRRLGVQPRFHQRLRDGVAGILGDLGDLIPEFADVVAALEDPATLRSFLLTLGMISTLRPDLVGPGEGPIAVFTDRDRGLGFLLYFLEHQAADADRGQLLERVTVSRRRLARDMFVSRMHVSRLLEEGEASGALRLSASDEIVFSPALSDHFETRMAVGLQVLRAVCVAARLDAPVDQGRLARVDRIGGLPVGHV